MTFQGMEILDKKSKQEIDKHRSNFYRADVCSRNGANSNSYFSLDNLVLDSSPFYVAVDKFSGFEGHYYYNEKDPLVKTAKQLIENPDLDLVDSYLFEYYQSFQPQTYGQVYQLSKKNKLHLLPQTSFFHPWLHSAPTNVFRAGLFGPKDITNVQHRVLRLKNLIKNIQDFGYKPNTNDIVEGYILLAKDDYRFLITGGHHRIAVVTALHQTSKFFHFNKVLVKYEKERSNIKIVDVSKSEDWPGVKSGYLTKADAEEMFNSYFS